MTWSLEAYPTTDLNDAHPDKVRQVMMRFQDFGAKRMFAGRIRTAVTMEDTKLVQQELFKTTGDGAVIVLDGGGSFRSALLGDLNADLLVEHGWSGIIINGVVRDARRLAEVDLGIKALGVTPVRSAKRGIGALGVPVSFGNVLFEEGQCVYCDEDGVLVSEEPLSL